MKHIIMCVWYIYYVCSGYTHTILLLLVGRAKSALIKYTNVTSSSAYSGIVRNIVCCSLFLLVMLHTPSLEWDGQCEYEFHSHKHTIARSTQSTRVVSFSTQYQPPAIQLLLSVKFNVHIRIHMRLKGWSGGGWDICFKTNINLVHVSVPVLGYCNDVFGQHIHRMPKRTDMLVYIHPERQNCAPHSSHTSKFIYLCV